MTIREMLSLFRNQAEMHWQAADSARQRTKYDLLAFNLSSAMSASLMTGLLQWRHRQGSPRVALQRVCEMARLGSAWLLELDGSRPSWTAIDPFLAGYCAILVDESVEVPCREVLVSWKSIPVERIGLCLDAGILSKLELNAAPAEWLDVLSRVDQPRRLRLLRDTYSAYSDMAAQPEPGERVTAALRALDLFPKRGSDPYFSGGRGTDGGGPDNPHVVDYRWAAIVKARGMVDDQLAESSHRWIW